MFDKNLTESEREIKNSPERKNEKTFKIVCAAICISLAGGFIYYEMNPEKFNKVSEEKININDSKEFLDNYTLSDKENEELSNNVIANNKNTEGYDKNGHPYLKEGLDYKDPANYTFENNGLGAPIEAPPKGKSTLLTNPNTNVQWAYTSSNKWHISSQAEHEREQEEINRSQNREYGKVSNISDEAIKQYMDGMVINMGSQ